MKFPVKNAVLILAFVLAASAGALAETCELRVTAVLGTGMEHLAGFSARAVDQRTRKSYRSVLSDEHRSFGELPTGNYKVFVSKPGYKTTVLPIRLSCQNGGGAYVAKMWKGSSRLYFTDRNDSSQLMELGLDLVATLGDTDSDRGVRVAPDNYTIQPDTDRPRPETVPGGVLNGKARSIPKPAYPAAARAVHAGGAVSVQVLIDYDGSVISATAVSGHPLLRAAAESAALGARFSPTLLSGQPVKVSGIITYNFVP